MTATPAAVVEGYRERVRFAPAEVHAVRPPRMLRGLLSAATHVAELPCGAGHFLSLYAERAAAVTLVDACSEMLALAVDRAVDQGLLADRVTVQQALVQELVLPAGVDVVVLPNAALNQLAVQTALPMLAAAVRAAVSEGSAVLAQVCCAHSGGAVDASTFYNDRRPHAQWFPDKVLRCEPTAGEVLRRRRQHRDGDQLRIEFDYRDQTGTSLHSAEVDLRVFTAKDVIRAFTAEGFTDIRFLPGAGGLSEISAIAGPGVAR